MTTIDLAQFSTTSKPVNDSSSIVTPPLSSIDYLYQAIALIEAKNAAIHSANQNSVKQSEPTKNGIQANYSNATIAAAAAAAVAAKNLNGSFIYRNPQLQQYSSLPDSNLKELIPSHYQNLGYFNRETTAVNIFSRDQVEIQCLDQFCDCISHMSSKCAEESNKSNSRLGKAKDFARRAVNIGDDYSDIKTENLESCTDSLGGSSRDHDEDSKELPSSPSTTSTPSPLATSSPINTDHFYQNHSNNHNFRTSSLSPAFKTTNNIGISTINSFEILKNILPIYLNSYLKTLRESLINSVPTSTQEQAAYIQTLTDLVHSITPYPHQNHEINHPIDVPQHSNFQNQCLNFLASSIYYPPTLKSTSSDNNYIISSNRNRPNIIESADNCYESSIPINTRSNLTGKDKLFLRKKKLTSIMKSNQKFNNSKYLIASKYNNVGTNLQNIKRNLFNSVSKAGSSLMSTSFIEVKKDALDKVEEHFKRSLGKKYFEYLTLSSLDC